MDREAAFHIIECLQKEGFTAYLAGGSVRDMLLGLASHDFDVATNASVEEIVSLFPKTLTVGAQFGVVIVLARGSKIEVATFRKDGSYSDGRKPDSIARGSPQEDAERRDFTINGLFYDPSTQTIFDFVEGQKDLQAKVLRAIGDPFARFAEDRLRMLRAIRFALRFDLTIAPQTYEAIKACSHLLLPSVSVERIFQELTKMEPKAQAFALLEETGLLKAIFPGESPRVSTLPALAKETPTSLYFALIFFQKTLNQWLKIARFFKCSHKEMSHLILLDAARQLDATSSLYTLAHYLAQDPELFYLEILARFWRKDPLWLTEFKYKQKMLKADILRIIEKRPLVTAAILQKEQIKPGPYMGQLLRQAEEIAINERLYTPEDVVRKLRLSGLLRKK